MPRRGGSELTRGTGVTTIFSVGRDLLGSEADYVSINSNASLLDADLVVFWPVIDEFKAYAEEYAGKTCLTATRSAEFKEAMAHWRKETREALRAGKHIVVFATDWEQVYFYTGQKQVSGTGRSQSTTHVVAPTTNYEWLPLDVGKVIPANGRSMSLTRGAEFMAPYWKAVGADSEYRVYLEDPKGTAVLTTKSGQRVVGLLARGAAGEGALLLIPPLVFDEDALTNEDGNWNEKGVQLGRRVFAAFVGVAKALSACFGRS